MTAGRKFLHTVPLLALAASCTAVGVLAATVFRPEAVLDRSIGNALAGPAPGSDVAAAQPPRIVDRPEFRLSRLDEGPLVLAKPIVAGDRIEISGRDGHRRALEVVDIRELDASVAQTEIAPGPRLLLVSCRDIDGAGSLVRFIIEADGLTPTPSRRPERAL